MAGLVGGVVLPLLGAVPDGAIMLFSGLGDIAEAQESLAVGVGALAGSTIMLLTVAWSICLFAGRVDYDDDGKPDYVKKNKRAVRPKSFQESLRTTGVDCSSKVNTGAKVMMVSSISYLLIQVPASMFHGLEIVEVGEKEHIWALIAFSVCVVGFVSYLYVQFVNSTEGSDDDKAVLQMQKQIDKHNVSLRTCIYDYFKIVENARETLHDNPDYDTLKQTEDDDFDPKASTVLRSLLKVPFDRHDRNKDGTLDKGEIRSILVEMGERDSKDFVDNIFRDYDTDNSGTINFTEFVNAAYFLYMKAFNEQRTHGEVEGGNNNNTGDDENEEEEEEGPEDLLDLDPEEQQRAIKIRAFVMLAVGTTLVVLFSDPMVDVLKQMSKRLNIPAFYVSFVLVPFASNASELLASQYYAMKKTKKTINVSFAALEGAAAMNNTFCLAIFMGIIIFRNGIVWQYTAETAAIMLVEIVVGILALKSNMTYLDGFIILGLYPGSIALVYILENVFGLD
jgi:Ca2+/Na+ antiporter